MDNIKSSNGSSSIEGSISNKSQEDIHVVGGQSLGNGDTVSPFEKIKSSYVYIGGKPIQTLFPVKSAGNKSYLLANKDELAEFSVVGVVEANYLRNVGKTEYNRSFSRNKYSDSAKNGIDLAQLEFADIDGSIMYDAYFEKGELVVIAFHCMG